RGNAAAVDLPAQVVDLRLGQAAFQEGARVDAGRGMALDVEQVAGVVFGRRTPEVVEADVVERGAGGEAGDVATEVAGLAVGPDHHRHRVPADDRADLPLHRLVTRDLGLQVRRDGVDV